jgi:hypothetical protein
MSDRPICTACGCPISRTARNEGGRQYTSISCLDAALDEIKRLRVIEHAANAVHSAGPGASDDLWSDLTFALMGIPVGKEQPA